MAHKTAIIIGAGQCGLAMSRALSLRAIDHLVIERGKIGESWRTKRWDSLRMLTPNWANGFEGARYTGQDPDGFMTPAEFVQQLETFAQFIDANVLEETKVQRVSVSGNRFQIESDTCTLTSDAVILATGGACRPLVPDLARYVPHKIFQTTPDRYRQPSDLPEGGVLVVGASASGVQLAREMRLSGREVTLAVGNHVRLPRSYRGHDIEHWLHVTGLLDQLSSETPDLLRAQKMTSPQLMGGEEDVDLNALQSLGVSVVGRLTEIRNGNGLFSGGLSSHTTSADLKMYRALDLIDAWIEEQRVDAPPADRPGPTVLPETLRLTVSLEDGSVSSIVWATGFAPDFSFLDLPVFSKRGRLIHGGGVCEFPGLYVLGLPLLRRKRSHQISGAGVDAEELAAHLALHLQTRSAA